MLIQLYNSIILNSMKNQKKNEEFLLTVEELEQRIAPDAGGINDPHDGPPGQGNWGGGPGNSGSGDQNGSNDQGGGGQAGGNPGLGDD
jgi:hypothetical protein